MKKGYLYIFLAAFLFSTMEISLKYFPLGLNPIQLNLLRFIIGAAVLLPFTLHTLKARGQKIQKTDWGFFALSGFFCIVVSMSFYQVAITQGKASLVAVIFSCNPAFVIPLAAMILHEHMTKRTGISMIISFCGIACIAIPLVFGRNSGSGSEMVTVLCAIASAFFFALYAVIGRTRSTRLGGTAVTCMSFLFGSIELLALIGISHIPAVADGLRAAHLDMFAAIPVFKSGNPAGWPGFLYVSVAVTGFGYAFYFLGIEKMGATIGSSVYFIKPALGPLLAWLIFGEAIGLPLIIGIALIIVGALVSILGKGDGAKAKAAKA